MAWQNNLLRVNLTTGSCSVFSRNEYRDSHTISAEISQADSALIVLCELGTDAIKPWANSRVTIENGKFCHENWGSCFTLYPTSNLYTFILHRSEDRKCLAYSVG